jgi:hypothetical protein
VSCAGTWKHQRCVHRHAGSASGGAGCAAGKGARVPRREVDKVAVELTKLRRRKRWE